MTIEPVLTWLQERRIRIWAPIIVTLGISLFIILPLTDEFNTARANRTSLRAGLARTRREVAQLEEVMQEADKARARLGRLQGRTVSAKDVHFFRQEVVELARKEGCQIRRIHLDDRRSQSLDAKNELFETVSGSERTKLAAYLVDVQSMTLSVSGTLLSIKHLLAELHAEKRMVSTKSLSLAAARGAEEQVVLDFEMLLFDLPKAEPAPG